jgi:hypothetical protein
VLVPGLVAGVTLGARRWGPAIGGWLTAFPLTSGPALFFLAMEQGDAFAARAAVAALVALIGVGAFGVAYGWTALRFGWGPSVLAGWAAFLLVTLLAQAVSWTPLAAVVCTLAAFALTVRLLPRARGRHVPSSPPAWDLPLRMTGTLVVVLVVTSVAERLGPALSGAFAPFPIAISVVAVFTHAQEGAQAVVRTLHGFYPAMWSMGLFCFVVALGLVPLGPWLGFLTALAVQMVVHGLVLWRMIRTGGPDATVRSRGGSRP